MAYTFDLTIAPTNVAHLPGRPQSEKPHGDHIAMQNRLKILDRLACKFRRLLAGLLLLAQSIDRFWRRRTRRAQKDEATSVPVIGKRKRKEKKVMSSKRGFHEQAPQLVEPTILQGL